MFVFLPMLPAASYTRLHIKAATSSFTRDSMPNFSKSGLNVMQVQFSLFLHLESSGSPLTLILFLNT